MASPSPSSGGVPTTPSSAGSSGYTTPYKNENHWWQLKAPKRTGDKLVDKQNSAIHEQVQGFINQIVQHPEDISVLQKEAAAT